MNTYRVVYELFFDSEDEDGAIEDALMLIQSGYQPLIELLGEDEETEMAATEGNEA